MSAPDQPVERDAETVALFVEESMEALQQVEQLLLEAERGEPAANMMATLFRAVHTIKGTAGYLAFAKTQSLSHTAEDLLSRLRDKRIEAVPAHFACLMVVGDRLRRMVENVRATGEEGQVEIEGLVAELKQAMQATPAADGAKAPTASAVAASFVPAPAAAAAPAATAPPTPAASAPAPTVPTAASAAASPAASAIAAPAAGLAATPATEGPAAPAAASSAAPSAAKPDPGDGTVRVNVAVLDRLMNLIGELVLARNQLNQVAKLVGDGSLSNQAVFQRLNVVTTELQEQVMKTRMQPVARVFEKIPRMVRDVAKQVGKEVSCEIEGNSTEIDKALVEAIRDPVMHIVRNALDHGIETGEERARTHKPRVGKLSVRAAHKGGAVTIEIEDDGKGMDPAFIRAHAVKKGVLSAAEAAKLGDRESIELVFRPGFSTAAKVTDISGRGVGMDVVRTHVEQAGGHAEIESVYGQGTTIRLKMPLTLAIIPALMVRAAGQRFAIPQVNLLELVFLSEGQTERAIEKVRGACIHRLRGDILPVVHLRDTLGLPERESEKSREGTYCVVVASGQRRYSMIVDGIDNTEEIVIKPLRGQLKRLSSYSGATVLGDGGVALILDVAGIASRAGIDLSTQRRADLAASAKAEGQLQTTLVFLAGGAQYAVPLSIVSRLERVRADAIETLAHGEVLQYRGLLLPIVRLASPPAMAEARDQLLVVFDFGRPTALAVDEVVDVLDVDVEAPTLREKQDFSFGMQVILGKATNLLDVFELLRAKAPASLQKKAPGSVSGRIVVADPSDASRGSLVSFLRGEGLLAVGVASKEALLKEVENGQKTPCGAIVADDGMLREAGAEYQQRFRSACKATPVFVQRAVDEAQPLSVSGFAGAAGLFSPSQREELVRSIKQGGAAVAQKELP